jgi:hypothetical protein
MRWVSETRSNSQRFQLLFFNRFRLQNNLPVSIEANLTTVQPFKEGVVESSSRVVSSNAEPLKL